MLRCSRPSWFADGRFLLKTFLFSVSMSREERNQGFLYLLTQATAAALESAEVLTKRRKVNQQLLLWSGLVN